MVAKHLSLTFLLLFLGVPLFLLLSVGLYSSVHVYSVCAYTSVHLHVNACTYMVFVVAMLQQLPSKLTSKVFNWLAVILEFVSVIIDHSTSQLLADIALWVTHLTMISWISGLCNIWLSVCTWYGTPNGNCYFSVHTYSSMFQNTERVS